LAEVDQTQKFAITYVCGSGLGYFAPKRKPIFAKLIWLFDSEILDFLAEVDQSQSFELQQT